MSFTSLGNSFKALFASAFDLTVVLKFFSSGFSDDDSAYTFGDKDNTDKHKVTNKTFFYNLNI
ncbi:hypothetical protein JPSP48_04540 [Staphylococcus pseudintermedius]